MPYVPLLADGLLWFYSKVSLRTSTTFVVRVNYETITSQFHKCLSINRKDTICLLRTWMYVILDLLQQLKVWDHEVSMDGDVLVLAISGQRVFSVV